MAEAPVAAARGRVAQYCPTAADFITAPSVTLSQRRIATRAPAAGATARLLYFARFPTTPFSVPP